MVNLSLKKERFWLITFTGLFSFFLFLPPFFLYLNELDWIESNHFNLQWITTSKEVALKTGETIGQSFVAEGNNLAKIAVRMHRGGKDSQSEYQFSLKNNPFDSEALKKGTFSLQKVFRTAYFEFEPIPDSQGKTFYFSIQPMPNTKEPLGFFIAENNLPSGDFYLNEQKQPEQDLVFQVYYKNSLQHQDHWI